MKKLFVVCAALLCGAGAVAQPSDKFNGSLLWKISGGGLDAPSYILGTYHLEGADRFEAIAGARAALEASSQVVGELIMADMGAMATQIQLAALMPEGESYRAMLSESDYEALDNGLKEFLGVGMEQFGMFKPGMISMMFAQVLFTKAFPEVNLQALVPMDILVQNFATEKGLPVVGLETVEDQITALFDSEPMKTQAESLACTIRNMDYNVEAAKKLKEIYEAAGLAAMYNDSFHDTNNPCPTSDEAKQALLKDRNDKWLAKLPEIMAAAPSFIAVGALHLAGEEGLLFQLDKKGYTVEAVK